MNKMSLMAVILLAACQSQPVPQNFEDLLDVTDRSDIPICTLPLERVREKLSDAELEVLSNEAFDFELLSSKYADEPVEQITILLRRAALKRRLNVKHDNTQKAVAYYNELNDGLPSPNSLETHHTKMHYWLDQVAKQDEIKDGNSDEYNLRFCVLNEARAPVHAASRKFILSLLSDESLAPNFEILENINHETYYADEFRKASKARLFTEEKLKNMSSLDMAMLRGETALLPSDSKLSDVFWSERDKEVDAILAHISTQTYETVAEKLSDMTMIDQSLRRLLSGTDAKDHFGNEAEFEKFSSGIWTRIVKVDEFNTAELQAMLEGRGWIRDDVDGEGASHNAWLIAQHADRKPDFQQEALKLIEADLGAPGVSKSNYAYLYDRVQMRFADGKEGMSERKQRYGTQGRCTGPGTWEPLPMEDPDNIDTRRAEVDLGTLDAYKARFKTICTEGRK